jgi:hypothetical protein
MTQAERDRLVTLKKAKKHLITQREAAAELKVTVRHVKRLLKELKKRGDKAVIHGLRGQPSPRRIAEATEQKAVKILSDPIYRGFGPTLGCEYLRQKHGLAVSKETLRKWMIQAGLWKAHRQKVEQVHPWRARRSRCGELAQWDTSDHDWLEGRGERIYLIAMIDDATSRLYARFVRSDSTEENMRVLWGYLGLYGRPVAFYTDKASLFQTADKRRRDEPGVDKDPVEMPPTQIGRALRELSVAWIPAHSAQAKGRVERGFSTAQDRLVKGLRVAGACTLEAANAYLESEFLPWWNQTLTVAPANACDAHRPLGKEHELAAILSHVEQRQVSNGYTVQYQGKLYQIDRNDIGVGLRGSKLRIEQRLDGSIAMRFADRYLRIQICEQPLPATPAPKLSAPVKPRKGPQAGGKSRWMDGFWDRPSPTLKQAIAIANATS